MPNTDMFETSFSLTWWDPYRLGNPGLRHVAVCWPMPWFVLDINTAGAYCTGRDEVGKGEGRAYISAWDL